MGFSYLSAAVILVQHFIGALFYLHDTKVSALACISVGCKDEKTCAFYNITRNRAYFEAAFWPFFALKRMF